MMMGYVKGGLILILGLIGMSAMATQPREVIEETDTYRVFANGEIEKKADRYALARPLSDSFIDREEIKAWQQCDTENENVSGAGKSDRRVETTTGESSRGGLVENAVPGLWKGFGGVPYGCNGFIDVIEKGPDGKIYLAGEFSACNDVAANNIVSWDPLTNTFEALGSVMPGLDDGIRDMAFNQAGDLIVVGDFRRAGSVDATRVARWDGAEWSAIGSNDFINQIVFSVAVDPVSDDLYIGGNFSEIFTSSGPISVNKIAVWNGTVWGPLGQGTDGFVEAIEFVGGSLFAGGDFLQAGSQTVNHIAAWDGNAWSSLGTGTNNLVSFLATDGTNLFASGSFNTAGGVETGTIARWDGSSWSSIDGPTSRIGGMNYGGGKLHITGGFTSINGVPAPRVASWDGTEWLSSGNSAFNGFGSAIYSDNEAIYVAGEFNVHGVIFLSDYPGTGFFANGIARFDIQAGNWGPMGNGEGNAPNGLVGSIVSTNNGIYIVGGGSNRWFDAVGTLITPFSFAFWDGESWSGVPGEPPCGGISFEGLAASGFGELFGNIGCISLGDQEWGRTAGWDGVEWRPLGSGVNERVYDLAVDQSAGDVFYGGGFTATLGDNPIAANRIARWDGSNWFSVGSGSENGISSTTSSFPTVRNIAPQTDQLMIAGNFDRAGTTAVEGLALWDGAIWSIPGDGLNFFSNSPSIIDLDSAGAEIFAAGRFDRSGSQPLRRIARWDGGQWLPLQGEVGEGVGFDPGALDATDEGLLYVGGSFDEAGGRPANRIARWDGADWASLGSGVSNGLSPADSERRRPVQVIASSPEGIFIGGEFSGSALVTGPNLIRFVPMENLNLDIEATVIDIQNGIISYELVITNNGEFALVDSVLEIDLSPLPVSVDWTCQPVAPAERGCPAASGSGPVNLLLELPSGASAAFNLTVNADTSEPFLDFEGSYRAAPVEGATGILSDTARISTAVSPEGVFKDDFE